MTENRNSGGFLIIYMFVNIYVVLYIRIVSVILYTIYEYTYQNAVHIKRLFI